MNHLAAGGVVGARHLTLVVSAVPGTRVSDKAVNKPSQISQCLEKTSIREAFIKKNHFLIDIRQ